MSKQWKAGDEFDAAIDALAALAQQAQPVHQFRRRLCADWYDGHPDHDDGGGPYETRILYTTPAVEPMTDEVRRSYQCLIAMNTPHGFGDRIGPFVKWLQDSGITAKAEGVRDGRST